MNRPVSKQKKSSKGKKVSMTLSHRDLVVLQRFAEQEGLTRAVALRHLVKEGLKEVAANMPDPTSKNQLDIFDSMQIDIFNNTSKTDNL